MVYEARHSRGLNFALAGAVLALSILGFAAAGVITTGSGSNPLVGWAIVAACLAAAFIFIRRGLDRSPQARIDEHGVYSRRLGREAVPWDRITGSPPASSASAASTAATAGRSGSTPPFTIKASTS